VLEAAIQKIREGHNEEALGLIRAQAANHPDWPPAPLILGRLLLAAGQAVPARRALERASAESPNHPQVYLIQGAVALGDGRLSDARLNFGQALELAGSGKWDAERARIFRREALAGLATVAEAREDWQAASGHLSAWLELDPKNGQARQRLGGVLFRLDKQDDAFAALKQAVQDTPSLEPAAVTMGRLHSQKGNTKSAEEWFDYALKLEPSNARVRLARAAWLLDQGHATAARPEIEEAVKLDPASREARRLQGLIAWHLRDLASAESILETLHREAPADLAVADLLALCLVEQDDAAKKSRGLQLAEVDARQSPRSQEALATLGWAHYRSSHLDEAEKMLRAAV
jgi:Flp pilus assembly protein TadD